MIFLPLFLLEVFPDGRWSFASPPQLSSLTCVLPFPRYTEYKAYLSLVSI